MFLTVRTSEMDQIAGLSLGADDYLGKPPHAQLLVHRVHALLRRREQNPTATGTLVLHGIEMNRQYYSAWIGKQALDLTRTEFELLWTLMAQPGRPFSRHELLDFARGQHTSAMERTIDVHVKSLRQKLGGLGEMIETVRGIGYRIARP
jgi:two-component system phosphate regulon response regulator PhoB